MPTKLSLSDSLLVQTLVEIAPILLLNAEQRFPFTGLLRKGGGGDVCSLTVLSCTQNETTRSRIFLMLVPLFVFFVFNPEWVGVENFSYNLEFSCLTFFNTILRNLVLHFNQSHAFLLSGYLLCHYSTLCNLC